MKFIIKQDPDTGEIINAWQSQKECANEIGVTQPAIAQSLKIGCKCRGYNFKKVNVPAKLVLDVIKESFENEVLSA